MKEILLNAFCMNAISHTHQGLWRHPRDESHRYTDLDYWVEFAQLLEEGKFDGIFMADGLGIYDVYEGRADAALRSGVMMPKNDPLLLVSAMAAATRNIGFGITCNVTDEPPYAFARKMSTLDHLTRGRIGWNIVTGFLDSAVKARGGEGLLHHDERYEVAEEYMDIVYQLWEKSWEDGAVLRDAENGVFADPSKVHRITHAGKYFKIDSIHMSEPSPQRTPVLFQAGASARGMAFAARHAECIYISGATPAKVGAKVKKIREAAAACGRGRDDIKVFVSMDIITAPTDAEAADKQQEYMRYIDPVGSLVRFSGFIGMDLSKLDLDETIKRIPSNAIQSVLENLASGNADKGWTVRDIANTLQTGGANAVIVGSPATVVDQLQRWMDEADVDGFNVPTMVKPDSTRDLVRLIVPEMQNRGVFKTEYRPGSMREKLFGQAARTPANHPSAGYRKG